jgi:hypothetical protein
MGQHFPSGLIELDGFVSGYEATTDAIDLVGGYAPGATGYHLTVKVRGGGSLRIPLTPEQAEHYARRAGGEPVRITIEPE